MTENRSNTILRSRTFTSSATGLTYFIDADGKAWLERDDVDEFTQGCECEMDWNCPLHQNRRGTWIETRYEGLDAEEALAHGRPWDA